MESDRVVSLKSLTEEQARGVLTGAEDIALSEQSIPRFTMRSYSVFRAEHAVVDGDLVMHFFLPEGVDLKKADPSLQRWWELYWLKTFPEKLDSVARSYFGAGKERLEARYTEEVASWWFRGRGFGQSLDPSALAEGFERALDSAVEEQHK